MSSPPVRKNFDDDDDPLSEYLRSAGYDGQHDAAQLCTPVPQWNLGDGVMPEASQELGESASCPDKHRLIRNTGAHIAEAYGFDSANIGTMPPPQFTRPASVRTFRAEPRRSPTQLISASRTATVNLFALARARATAVVFTRTKEGCAVVIRAIANCNHAVAIPVAALMVAALAIAFGLARLSDKPRDAITIPVFTPSAPVPLHLPAAGISAPLGPAANRSRRTERVQYRRSKPARSLGNWEEIVIRHYPRAGQDTASKEVAKP